MMDLGRRPNAAELPWNKQHHQPPPFAMNVPFISSGAQSRAHYALVRKVEGASSPQQADQYLLAEVNSIRARLGQPGLSLVRVEQLTTICKVNINADRKVSGRNHAKNVL